MSVVRRCLFNLVILSHVITSACAGVETGNTSLAENGNSVIPPVHLEIDERQDREVSEVLARLNALFITKPETAFEIGKQTLNLSSSKPLILCDGGLSWRVIDPKERKEVWIAKDNGSVYADPIDISRNVFDNKNERGRPVGKSEAFEIAKRHYVEYGRQAFNSDESIVLGYFSSVCDVDDYWRVYFLPNDLKTVAKEGDIGRLSHIHPPDYVIEKQTGNIIYFNSAN